MMRSKVCVDGLTSPNCNGALRSDSVPMMILEALHAQIAGPVRNPMSGGEGLREGFHGGVNIECSFTR